MTEYDVSVLLLTKNAGQRFNSVLERIASQQTSRAVEIVVVDSGSTDGTLELAEQFADVVEEIRPEEFHHSRTRNLAADIAQGSNYIFLTQDASPTDTDWLENLLNPLLDPNVGVVYGRQVAYPEAKPMEEFFYSFFYPTEERILQSENVVDAGRFYLENVFVSDVCSAIQGEVFDEIRFHEDVPMSEDKDFALRVLDEGYKVVYEPNASVFHSHDYTMQELFWRRFEDGKAYSKIAGGGIGNFSKTGVNYVLKEMSYLLENRYLWWIPYALLYDITYFLGFQAGRLRGKG